MCDNSSHPGAGRVGSAPGHKISCQLSHELSHELSQPKTPSASTFTSSVTRVTRNREEKQKGGLKGHAPYIALLQPVTLKSDGLAKVGCHLSHRPKNKPQNTHRRTPQMREKTIEQKFTRAVKNAGGQALKFTSPSLAGVPDRIILMPGGRMAFAEIKAPGKKPRPLQQRRIQQLAALGYTTYIIDHPSQIPGVIHALQTTPIPGLHD